MTKYDLLLKAINLQSDLKNSLEDSNRLITAITKNGSGLELDADELEKCIRDFNLIKSIIHNKTN